MHADLGDLDELLADDDFEAIAVVVDVASDDERGALTLGVEVRSATGVRLRREVRCTGAVRWTVSDELFSGIAVYDEHPALWPFTAPQAALYFRGRPADPRLLAARIEAEHADLAGRFVDFSDVVNPNLGRGVAGILATGHGLLASGPVPLLERYRALAEAEALETTVQPLQLSEDVDPALGVLELGRTFVVASAFAIGS